MWRLKAAFSSSSLLFCTQRRASDPAASPGQALRLGICQLCDLGSPARRSAAAGAPAPGSPSSGAWQAAGRHPVREPTIQAKARGLRPADSRLRATAGRASCAWPWSPSASGGALCTAGLKILCCLRGPARPVAPRAATLARALPGGHLGRLVGRRGWWPATGRAAGLPDTLAPSLLPVCRPKAACAHSMSSMSKAAAGAKPAPVALVALVWRPAWSLAGSGTLAGRFTAERAPGPTAGGHARRRGAPAAALSIECPSQEAGESCWWGPVLQAVEALEAGRPVQQHSCQQPLGRAACADAVVVVEAGLSGAWAALHRTSPSCQRQRPTADSPARVRAGGGRLADAAGRLAPQRPALQARQGVRALLGACNVRWAAPAACAAALEQGAPAPRQGATSDAEGSTWRLLPPAAPCACWGCADAWRPRCRGLPGYIGLWQFYKAEGSDAEALQKSFRCARLYCTQTSSGARGWEAHFAGDRLRMD